MARANTASFDEASWLRLDRTPGEPLRAALERALRGAIREGALRAGVRLPSSRRFAAQVGVSRGVASDVYAQLEAQGFIEMQPRRAPLVAAVATPHLRPPRSEPTADRSPRFDLTPTTPDVTLFPMRHWLAALKRAAGDAPLRALDYGDPRGDLGLRETLADHLGRTRGVVADADLRYRREPVRALQGLDPDRVAYLGTVSKTLAPALRLGWLVAPPALAEEAAQTK